MRRHSNPFFFVLVGAAAVLATLFRSMYEDAVKAWVFAQLTKWGLGQEAVAVTSGFVEITPAVGGAIAVVWFVHWYIKREFERSSLVFVRELRSPAGDFGHYRAYVTVQNTSPTEKLKDCRCEIVELRHESGELVGEHIGLRTQNQEARDKGRFNLDQGSEKEVPLFDIDQSVDDNALLVINADNRDIGLEHGIYTAKIRGYGDRGKADEITVRLDTSNCNFEIIAAASRA